jgi:hypothetical protein
MHITGIQCKYEENIIKQNVKISELDIHGRLTYWMRILHNK